jgi:hypothetical protein
MTLPICASCPPDLRSRCTAFNNPLHKARKGEKPTLAEHEKACLLLKHIYVTQGNESLVYECGILEINATATTGEEQKSV